MNNDYYQDLNKRDLWIENKNNIPTIDFSISDSINESNVLFVPPFTPYSIQLNEENKSVTLSFKFLDSDSTISSKRLKELESLVIEALEKNNYYLKN